MSSTTATGHILKGILETFALGEALKRELRHSWLSDGRRESVAEHTFQMALLALLAHPYLESAVNLERTLKMILVHDLVEAVTGDIPFFETSDRKIKKQEMERKAMEEISRILPPELSEAVPLLWEEFEGNETKEAKFARAMDHLEVQMQHNLADFATWETVERGLVYTKMDKYCSHDSFLAALCCEVKAQAERKLMDHGVDIEALKSSISSETSA